MPSANEEKRPSEIVRLLADFSQALLTGESIVSGSATIQVVNMLTDADSTASILVTATTASTATTIAGQFQAGLVGDLYQILFNTGLTNFNNRYTATATLSITDKPAADTLLCTLEEMKLALRIPTTDTSDDELLLQMISFATAYAQQRTGRYLFFQTLTEDVLRGCTQSDDEIQLWEYPVKKIDSITLYPSGWLEPVALDAASFTFSEDGRVSLFATAPTAVFPFEFPEEPGYTRVIYRAGYARIPDDLRLAAQRVASVFYRNLGREGLSGERIGDYSWSAASAGRLPSGTQAELSDPMIEGVLSRYARTSIVRA